MEKYKRKKPTNVEVAGSTLKMDKTNDKVQRALVKEYPHAFSFVGNIATSDTTGIMLKSSDEIGYTYLITNETGIIMIAPEAQLTTFINNVDLSDIALLAISRGWDGSVEDSEERSLDSFQKAPLDSLASIEPISYTDDGAFGKFITDVQQVEKEQIKLESDRKNEEERKLKEEKRRAERLDPDKIIAKLTPSKK